jgi:hypothetical protein
VFGAASYFRNGRAPNVSVTALPWEPNAGASRGYAFGGGLEWRWNRAASMQATVDRFAQVGEQDVGTVARNIFALRLVLTAW